jgi:cellulase/cellobiase CelA1
MNACRVALPTFLLLAACSGVDPASDELGAARQGLESDDCTADYRITSSFEGGFMANVRITNEGDPSVGWEVRWTYLGDERVAQFFNANVAQSGADVTATNLSFNGTLGTGQSANFGVIGTNSGGLDEPSDVECIIER